MPFLETGFPGLLIVEPRIFEDGRGYFYESYNQALYADNGIDCRFVQDNQAASRRGVLRGLHFQTGEYAQAKLVRVLVGSVWDVVVDLREDSPRRGQWFGIELSAENRRQLFVPRGFAHGYIALSEHTEFFYKCDNFYSKAHEGGIRYDDPGLNIDWKLPADCFLVSDKDRALGFLSGL